MHTLASNHGQLAGAALLPTAEFVLGEWLVEPDLNRVSRDGQSAHVRPQLMDLLVYLAHNTGRTVPHDELLAQVWPDQPFVTGTALPRCIAELRHTLGDRASSSRVIQTIPKRGYRLIAPVAPVADAPSAQRPETPHPSQPAPAPGMEPLSSEASSPVQPSKPRRFGWLGAAPFQSASALVSRLWKHLGLRAG